MCFLYCSCNFSVNLELDQNYKLKTISSYTPDLSLQLHTHVHTGIEMPRPLPLGRAVGSQHSAGDYRREPGTQCTAAPWPGSCATPLTQEKARASRPQRCPSPTVRQPCAPKFSYVRWAPPPPHFLPILQSLVQIPSCPRSLRGASDSHHELSCPFHRLQRAERWAVWALSVPQPGPELSTEQQAGDTWGHFAGAWEEAKAGEFVGLKEELNVKEGTVSPAARGPWHPQTGNEASLKAIPPLPLSPSPAQAREPPSH